MDILDNYWIAYKNGEYISGTDEFGYPIHTKDRKQAYKFYNFNVAMTYFSMGYCIIKE